MKRAGLQATSAMDFGETYAFAQRKRKQNSQVTQVQFFTSEKLEKKVPNDLSDVKSILWRQIYLNILQGEELFNHTQFQDT